VTDEIVWKGLTLSRKLTVPEVDYLEEYDVYVDITGPLYFPLRYRLYMLQATPEFEVCVSVDPSEECPLWYATVALGCALAEDPETALDWALAAHLEDTDPNSELPFHQDCPPEHLEVFRRVLGLPDSLNLEPPV